MDLSAYKSIKIAGIELKKILIGGVVAWAKKTFTNQVPISTDTDGSIFNGVGYKENVRLSSSGGISGSAQAGSVTTGFIPWGGDGDVIRIKGVEWLNAQPNHGGHYYIMFYNENKEKNGNSAYIESPASGLGHIMTITRDENGVETIVFNKDYGTSNAFLQNVRAAKYFRMTAYGKGANFVLTINEEI
jgi:hypothetical protein